MVQRIYLGSKFHSLNPCVRVRRTEWQYAWEHGSLGVEAIDGIVHTQAPTTQNTGCIPMHPRSVDRHPQDEKVRQWSDDLLRRPLGFNPSVIRGDKPLALTSEYRKRYVFSEDLASGTVGYLTTCGQASDVP